MIPGKITLTKRVVVSRPEARADRHEVRIHGADPREHSQRDREEAEEHAEGDLRRRAQTEEEHERRVPDDARDRIERGHQRLVDRPDVAGQPEGEAEREAEQPTVSR